MDTLLSVLKVLTKNHSLVNFQWSVIRESCLTSPLSHLGTDPLSQYLHVTNVQLGRYIMYPRSQIDLSQWSTSANLPTKNLTLLDTFQYFQFQLVDKHTVILSKLQTKSMRKCATWLPHCCCCPLCHYHTAVCCAATVVPLPVTQWAAACCALVMLLPAVPWCAVACRATTVMLQLLRHVCWVTVMLPCVATVMLMPVVLQPKLHLACHYEPLCIVLLPVALPWPCHHMLYHRTLLPVMPWRTATCQCGHKGRWALLRACVNVSIWVDMWGERKDNILMRWVCRLAMQAGRWAGHYHTASSVPRVVTMLLPHVVLLSCLLSIVSWPCCCYWHHCHITVAWRGLALVVGLHKESEIK